MVHFVGAGSGAPDLITVRGQKLLAEADTVIYAGSLVNPELLQLCRADADIYDSAKMTLPEVIAVMEQAETRGKTTVRLHTGDPSLYGAIREQMDELDRRGISYQVTPGVSSFCGAAAALSMEYTLPEVSQSVIITRMEGRTAVPEREKIASLAAHRATMVIFLSASLTEQLEEELLRGGYPEETPAAIVYKATWPDEERVLCTVGTLHETAAFRGISRTALIIVGDAVSQSGYARSRLYAPDFSTGYRQAQTGPSSAGADDAPARERLQRADRSCLYVVGIGPGDASQMTAQAEAALTMSSHILGYQTYVDLVRESFPDKQFLTTGMRGEEERCRKALMLASEGNCVSLICSGDAGVYGLAGLVLEMAEEYPETEIRIVPGVTAALSGAALLGAPLIHDFAVISLSDLLTPWEEIERRLQAAAEADFSLVLYNPASRKRADYLRRAAEILLRTLPGERACGVVRRIGRDGEQAEVCTLAELPDLPADMFTTVFVGKSTTRIIGGRLVTPRGYRSEKNGL